MVMAMSEVGSSEAVSAALSPLVSVPDSTATENFVVAETMDYDLQARIIQQRGMPLPTIRLRLFLDQTSRRLSMSNKKRTMGRVDHMSLSF